MRDIRLLADSDNEKLSWFKKKHIEPVINTDGVVNSGNNSQDVSNNQN